MRLVAIGLVTHPGPRPKRAGSVTAAFSTSGGSSPICLYAPRRAALAAAFASAGAWVWLNRPAAACTPLRFSAPPGSLIGNLWSDLLVVSARCRQHADFHCWSV